MSAGEFAVILHARSAVFVKAGEQVLLNNPAIGGGILITSENVAHPSQPESLQLVLEARGLGDGLEEAAAHLGGLAGSLLLLISLLMNAAVDEARLHVVSDIAAPGETGRFVQEASMGPLPPDPVVMRPLKAQALCELVEALDRHPITDVLWQASAHYAEALRNWHEHNSIRVAQSVFQAAEALERAIVKRMLHERGWTKQQRPDLAAELGLEKPHDLEPYVRRTVVFAEDPSVGSKLRAGSDQFEHSFRPFDAIRNAVDGRWQPGARMVRHALLKEIGISYELLRDLTTDPLDTPLPSWPPLIAIEGDFTPAPGASALEERRFPGGRMAFTGQLTSARAQEKGATQQFQFNVEGDMSPMPDGMQAHTRARTTNLPGNVGGKVEETGSTLIHRRDGKIIERREEGPADPPAPPTPSDDEPPPES